MTRFFLLLAGLLMVACQTSQNDQSSSHETTPAAAVTGDSVTTAPVETSSATAHEKVTEENTSSVDPKEQTGTPSRKESSVSKPSVTAKQWTLTKKIRDTLLGMELALPAGWQQNGETVRAFGRNGELLNTEALYRDSTGRYELDVKTHPAPNGEKIWAFYRKQFDARKGPFSKKAEVWQQNGKEILYGVSERLYDGKGHPLNPPAKVYTAVWYDADQGKEYEIFLRVTRPGEGDAELFERLLRSLKTY